MQPEQLRRQMHRHGNPAAGETWRTARPEGPRVEERWKSGRIFDKEGYVLVKAHDHPHANGSGYVREHRLVMEQHLG